MTLLFRPVSTIVAALLAMHAGASALAQAPAPTPRALTIANAPRTGDFDAMLERRLIRVAVPVSRTLYFNDKGRERGITADTDRDFARYLNQ